MAKIILEFEPVTVARTGYFFNDLVDAINASEWKPKDVKIVTEDSITKEV